MQPRSYAPSVKRRRGRFGRRQVSARYRRASPLSAFRSLCNQLCARAITAVNALKTGNLFLVPRNAATMFVAAAVLVTAQAFGFGDDPRADLYRLAHPPKPSHQVVQVVKTAVKVVPPRSSVSAPRRPHAATISRGMGGEGTSFQGVVNPSHLKGYTRRVAERVLKGTATPRMKLWLANEMMYAAKGNHVHAQAIAQAVRASMPDYLAKHGNRADVKRFLSSDRYTAARAEAVATPRLVRPTVSKGHQGGGRGKTRTAAKLDSEPVRYALKMVSAKLSAGPESVKDLYAAAVQDVRVKYDGGVAVERVVIEDKDCLARAACRQNIELFRGIKAVLTTDPDRSATCRGGCAGSLQDFWNAGRADVAVKLSAIETLDRPPARSSRGLVAVASGSAGSVKL